MKEAEFNLSLTVGPTLLILKVIALVGYVALTSTYEVSCVRKTDMHCDSYIGAPRHVLPMKSPLADTAGHEASLSGHSFAMFIFTQTGELVANHTYGGYTVELY